VAYHLSEEHPFLGREIHEQRQFSEHTQQLIDEEVARLLHESDAHARDILHKHRDKLDKVAKELIKREVLDEDEIEDLIGPSAYVAHEGNGSAAGEPQSEKVKDDVGAG
jgi:cell division protease FtsH